MAWVEGQNAKLAEAAGGRPALRDLPRRGARDLHRPGPHPDAALPGRRRSTTSGRTPATCTASGGTRALASYRTASPQWETLLDLDALSKAEGKNWIWKGADCLKPAQTLCLVAALRRRQRRRRGPRVRHRDQAASSTAASACPSGKQNVDWIDPDTLIVGRDWTPGEVTTSGYPYVVKIVDARRGEPREVFRGAEDRRLGRARSCCAAPAARPTAC